MDRTMGKAALALLGVSALLLGCGQGDAKFRTQLDPVVARITQLATSAAGLTGGPAATTIEQATTMQTDIAGMGADLKSLYVDGDKQKALVAAGQAYLSATQRFVAAQQEFARAHQRLDAARKKVRDSLDAKARTSKFSMDFWKESHDRLLVEIDKVRNEALKVRDQLAAATNGLQQAADAAGKSLGREKLISPAALEAHRKALAGVNLEKGA